jgi:hypothetical protein
MPTYCTINEAYGGPFSQRAKTAKPKEDTSNSKPNEAPIVPTEPEYGPMNGQKFECPTCKQCLKDNNWFQQKVINESIWPLPRWVPQQPYPIAPYDPWSRIFPMREHFGGSSNLDNKTLLKLFWYFLIALFVINFLELIVK